MLGLVVYSRPDTLIPPDQIEVDVTRDGMAVRSQRALLVVVLVITFVALDGIEGAGIENLLTNCFSRKKSFLPKL